jgi:hypothetical protein
MATRADSGFGVRSGIGHAVDSGPNSDLAQLRSPATHGERPADRRHWAAEREPGREIRQSVAEQPDDQPDEADDSQGDGNGEDGMMTTTVVRPPYSAGANLGSASPPLRSSVRRAAKRSTALAEPEMGATDQHDDRGDESKPDRVLSGSPP